MWVTHNTWWPAAATAHSFSPSLKRTDLFSPGYEFYASATPALLRWLAGEAERAGAEIRYSAPLQAGEQSREAVRLAAGAAAIEAAWLLGADGAKSAVAERSHREAQSDPKASHITTPTLIRRAAIHRQCRRPH